MDSFRLLLLAARLLSSPVQAPTPLSDPPKICTNCDEWNRPQAPFKLHGPSYYVGVRGLSAVLIHTSDGLILLDGGLPQSAPLIEANIRSLGFKVEDVKLILNSHAHFDHAGGLARLQRDSGAMVAASESGAQALMSGLAVPDDPQFGEDSAFPPVSRVKVVKDKEGLRVADTVITPHFTPGHTPGSTTWTWRSCDGGDCLNLVYADSLTPVSNEGFRFLGDATHKDLSKTFRRSIANVGGLPCDIMLSTHPEASALFDKLARRTPGVTPDPLIDKEGCRAYAAQAGRNLDERLKTEGKAVSK